MKPMREISLFSLKTLLVGLVGLGLVAGVGRHSLSASGTVTGDPLSLKALLQRSQFVFVGTVETVRQEQAEPKEGSGSLARLRVVTFRDVDVLKPHRFTVPKLVLRQHDVGYAVAQNQRVLWFVEEYAPHLKGPVGGQSGYFLIRRDWSGELCGKANCETAVNLADNKGLWGAPGLWEDFSRSDTKSRLRGMDVPEQEIGNFLKIGDNAWKSGPLPLVFIEALVP